MENSSHPLSILAAYYRDEINDRPELGLKLPAITHKKHTRLAALLKETVKSDDGKRSEQTCGLLVLPAELKYQICSYLSTKDVLTMEYTSLDFRNFAREYQSYVVKADAMKKFGSTPNTICDCEPGTEGLGPFDGLTLEGWNRLEHVATVADNILEDFRSFLIWGLNVAPSEFSRPTMEIWRPQKANMLAHINRLTLHMMKWHWNYHNQIMRAMKSRRQKIPHLEISEEICRSMGKRCLLDLYAFFQLFRHMINEMLRPDWSRSARFSNGTSQNIMKVYLLGGMEAWADILASFTGVHQTSLLDRFLGEVNSYVRGNPHTLTAHNVSQHLAYRPSPAGDRLRLNMRNVVLFPRKQPALVPEITKRMAIKIINNLPTENEYFQDAAQKVLIEWFPTIKFKLPTWQQTVRWMLDRDGAGHLCEVEE